MSGGAFYSPPVRIYSGGSVVPAVLSCGYFRDSECLLGFQGAPVIVVKTGILPFPDTSGQAVTVTYNDSNKFEDRWVYLAPVTDRCVFIEKGRQIYLPIAHGEGKVVTKDQQTLDKLKAEGFVAFKYVDENGNEGGYPVNPNGSMASIAGLTDSTGRVLGLMPHPERHVRFTQHPRWTRDEKRETKEGDGMTIFNNAVKYVSQNL